jgi:hypothetical protein
MLAVPLLIHDDRTPQLGDTSQVGGLPLPGELGEAPDGRDVPLCWSSLGRPRRKMLAAASMPPDRAVIPFRGRCFSRFVQGGRLDWGPAWWSLRFRIISKQGPSSGLKSGTLPIGPVAERPHSTPRFTTSALVFLRRGSHLSSTKANYTPKQHHKAWKNGPVVIVEFGRCAQQSRPAKLAPV